MSRRGGPAPVVTRSPDERAGEGRGNKDDAQAELLYNRLVKRHRHLRKWARRAGVDAYRLYDRDIPEIPLVLDLYGDAVSGALFERPYEKDEDDEARWLQAMTAAAAAALGVPPDRVFLKRRRRHGHDPAHDPRPGCPPRPAQYDKLAAANVWRDVHEDGLMFRVNLSDYLDTGLFLDARPRRRLIRAASAGLRVLNLFAYTCAASVAAAAGGAIRVDSVDLSHTYLDWGAVNFALNRQSVAAAACPLTRADVRAYLRDAARASRRWDLIVLDPPAFSNSRAAPTLDLRRDHRELIQSCLDLLAPRGRVLFSAAARSFRLDPAAFPGVTVTPTRLPPDDDFRKARHPPACWEFLKGE